MGFKKFSTNSFRASSPGAAFILGAMICAIIAGVLVINALRLAAPTVPVIVAKKDIEPGQTITEEMLDVKYYPKAILPGDRITGKNFDNMIGRHARTAIAAGDPVRMRHVAELAPGGGTVAARLSLAGHPEWRAISLPAEASQGLEVEPGDRVDIIGTIDAGDQVTTSKVLVWAAPVIHAPRNTGETDREGGIVVALKPADVERVFLAMTKGEVLVALNPLGEAAGQHSTGVKLTEILATQVEGN